ncbi:MAG: PAS domain-containing protein [Proteobacteria bacterium]|nr:PAS domain-containing protein [Pseudomonadota bacterium]
MRGHVTPTGVERTFRDDELIVSKTDPTGRITYANELFVQLSGYTREELMGAAHSIIRHPDMPRAIFKLLWDTIASGQEIFAFVKNLSKNGDHYWVLAHVTPTLGEDGHLIGYHSNRRTADRGVVATLTPIYAAMCETERRQGRTAGFDASLACLTSGLQARHLAYDDLVFGSAS